MLSLNNAYNSNVNERSSHMKSKKKKKSKKRKDNKLLKKIIRKKDRNNAATSTKCENNVEEVSEETTFNTKLDKLWAELDAGHIPRDMAINIAALENQDTLLYDDNTNLDEDVYEKNNEIDDLLKVIVVYSSSHRSSSKSRSSSLSSITSTSPRISRRSSFNIDNEEKESVKSSIINDSVNIDLDYLDSIYNVDDIDGILPSPIDDPPELTTTSFIINNDIVNNSADNPTHIIVTAENSTVQVPTLALVVEGESAGNHQTQKTSSSGYTNKINSSKDQNEYSADNTKEEISLSSNHPADTKIEYDVELEVLDCFPEPPECITSPASQHTAVKSNSSHIPSTAIADLDVLISVEASAGNSEGVSPSPLKENSLGVQNQNTVTTNPCVTLKSAVLRILSNNILQIFVQRLKNQISNKVITTSIEGSSGGTMNDSSLTPMNMDNSERAKSSIGAIDTSRRHSSKVFQTFMNKKHRIHTLDFNSDVWRKISNELFDDNNNIFLTSLEAFEPTSKQRITLPDFSSGDNTSISKSNDGLDPMIFVSTADSFNNEIHSEVKEVLRYISKLDVSSHRISELTMWSENCFIANVAEIDASYNQIQSVNLKLNHLVHLDLSNNELTFINKLDTPNLKKLNLSNNRFSGNIDDIFPFLDVPSVFSNLKELDLSNNNILWNTKRNRGQNIDLLSKYIPNVKSLVLYPNPFMISNDFLELFSKLEDNDNNNVIIINDQNDCDGDVQQKVVYPSWRIFVSSNLTKLKYLDGIRLSSTIATTKNIKLKLSKKKQSDLRLLEMKSQAVIERDLIQSYSDICNAIAEEHEATRREAIHRVSFTLPELSLQRQCQEISVLRRFFTQWKCYSRTVMLLSKPLVRMLHRIRYHSHDGLINYNTNTKTVESALLLQSTAFVTWKENTMIRSIWICKVKETQNVLTIYSQEQERMVGDSASNVSLVDRCDGSISTPIDNTCDRRDSTHITTGDASSNRIDDMSCNNRSWRQACANMIEIKHIIEKRWKKEFFDKWLNLTIEAQAVNISQQISVKACELGMVDYEINNYKSKLSLLTKESSQQIELLKLQSDHISVEHLKETVYKLEGAIDYWRRKINELNQLK